MNIKSNSNDESEEDSQLRSRTIDELNDESLSETVDEIENGLVPEKVVNRLTTLVRKQYHAYIEKLLKENIETWCTHQQLEVCDVSSEEWIKKCASQYEEKALKSCMIVQFYRKSMLKIIANIRRETLHGKLAYKLRDVKEENRSPTTVKKVGLVNASTQTGEDCKDIKTETNTVDAHKDKGRNNQVRTLSLDERIECFQKQLEKQEKKFIGAEKHRSRRESFSYIHKRKRSISFERARKSLKASSDKQESPHAISPQLESPIEGQLPEPDKSCEFNLENSEIKTVEEDEVAKELEMLFSEEKDEVDEIFGEGNCDPKIDQILKEIEQAKLPGIGTKYNTSTAEIHGHGNTPHVGIQKMFSKQDENTLYESIWPCELHMRQQKLRKVLMGVADRGIRCHARIKAQYLELFGEDSDDEFAVYSPTLELNEVLVASCKKRIAPWIVKHLMIPMKKGLIGNRFLFKKLAKKLATNIIMENQYPDENYIKYTVENYFCYKRNIMSMDDIEFA